MSLEAPPQALLDRWPWAYREFIQRAVWALQGDPTAYVTSWWRSREMNNSVGGHPYSQHRLGFAVDVITPAPSLIADRFRSAGLVPVIEGSHVHVQAFPAGTIPQSFFVY